MYQAPQQHEQPADPMDLDAQCTLVVYGDDTERWHLAGTGSLGNLLRMAPNMRAMWRIVNPKLAASNKSVGRIVAKGDGDGVVELIER